MSRREQLLAYLLIAAMLLHAPLAFYDRRIPAWSMFANADRYNYLLIDAAGNPVSIRDYVPARAYVVADRQMPLLIAQWLVANDRIAAPAWCRREVWSGIHSRDVTVEVLEVRITRSANGAAVWKLRANSQ